MQNIDVTVGRSTSSPETSETAAVPRYLLPARSGSLPNIKITARDEDADADEGTANKLDGVVRGEDDAVQGEHDVVRGEGDNEGDAAHDEARPLATYISDRIPIEMYETVFEHMDRFTLFIAALVSRAWYHHATSCLYYTVVISSRASYDLLVKQLRTSPRVQRWLQSTHEVAFGYGSSHQGIPFLDAFPLVFGLACPSLQVLDIGDHMMRPNMHPTFHLGLRQLQYIVSLRLHEVELSNIVQLRRIVFAFLYLEELVLDNVLLSQPQLPQSAGARLQDDLCRGPCNIRLKRLRVEARSALWSNW